VTLLHLWFSNVDKLTQMSAPHLISFNHLNRNCHQRDGHSRRRFLWYYWQSQDQNPARLRGRLPCRFSWRFSPLSRSRPIQSIMSRLRRIVHHARVWDLRCRSSWGDSHQQDYHSQGRHVLRRYHEALRRIGGDSHAIATRAFLVRLRKYWNLKIVCFSLVQRSRTWRPT